MGLQDLFMGDLKVDIGRGVGEQVVKDVVCVAFAEGSRLPKDLNRALACGCGSRLIHSNS
jgi:hypothetical protein